MDKTISVVGHTAIDLLFDVEHISCHNESYPIIDYHEYFGGGAANIAVGIATLGGKCQLISAVGDDFASSGYEDYLMSLGVDLSLLYKCKGQKVTKAFVFTDREHNQSTYFHWGASALLKYFEPPEVDFVHLATSECSFNARTAKKAGFVSFDPGQDLVTYNRKDLETILEHTDILFANRHEIKRVCEMTDRSFEELKESIDIIVVTYDSEGSMIHTDDAQYCIPVVPVKAVDPTGAGDAYRAGFLLAFTRGYDVATCGKIGATVASFAVEVVGYQVKLPTWEMMQERFETHFGKLQR